MWDGRKKAVTFSYDDGITQDKRLIKLLDRYGLKCTFNINSGFLGTHNSLVREDVTVAHVKPRACEVKEIYKDHEVAAHTLTHPWLPRLTDEEVIHQVENDRRALSDIVEYDVVGMAYPGGGENFTEHTAGVIRRNTGIKYARTIISNHSFDVQDDLYVFKPTVYHHAEWNELFRLGKEFTELETDTPKIFYIWGHAYELDIHDDWERFEEFCKLIAGKEDICYCTNREALLM